MCYCSTRQDHAELQLGGEVNSVFVEIIKNSLNAKKNVICGCIYRPPSMSLVTFNKLLCDMFNPCVYPSYVKGNAAYLKKYIMDENDALSVYKKIPLGHNRTNGAVYSKINFKVEICSAH